jgi:alginate O-acetyltransferase complex protein AlgI
MARRWMDICRMARTTLPDYYLYMAKNIRVPSTLLTRNTARVLTFLAIVIDWVLFRAESWDATLIILSAMAGLSDIIPIKNALDINLKTAFLILLGLLIAVWVMPNSYQNLSRYNPVLDDKRLPVDQIWKPLDYKWGLTTGWAYISALVATTAVFMLTRVSEFL